MLNICLFLAIAIASASCTTVDPVKNQARSNKYTCSDHPKAQSGKVTLLVDVDASGKAENIRIVESNPTGAFDETARCIVEQETFSKSKDGKRPPFKDHKAEYQFKMPDKS